MSLQKDIILFGIQGCGKGTQADLLLQKLSGYQYFEPGNIFRALKSNDNVLWQHIKDRMDAWKMVDDAITFGVFDIYQHLLGNGEHMLIDGFLRTTQQMHYYFFQENKHKRDFIALHYVFSREKALQRILKRAQEEGRADDVQVSIEQRLDIYEQETIPVIAYLDSLGKVLHINADQSVDAIFQETVEKLGL